LQKISFIWYNIEDIFKVKTMTANAQFAGWPQIDETLDARMDRDAAEREYASLW
jgi:hypothetical protein